MKTALESYIDWLKHNIKIAEQYKLEPKLLNVCLENAERFLPMEKEQIKDAFVECWKANVPDGIECKLDAEQYYNKIFKSE